MVSCDLWVWRGLVEASTGDGQGCIRIGDREIPFFSIPYLGYYAGLNSPAFASDVFSNSKMHPRPLTTEFLLMLCPRGLPSEPMWML